MTGGGLGVVQQKFGRPWLIPRNGSSVSIYEGQMVLQQAVFSLCTCHKGFYCSGNSDKP